MKNETCNCKLSIALLNRIMYQLDLTSRASLYIAENTTFTNADVENLIILYHAEPRLWNSADLDKRSEALRRIGEGLEHKYRSGNSF